MKKALSLLLILVMLLSLCACGGTDDREPQTGSSSDDTVSSDLSGGTTTTVSNTTTTTYNENKQEPTKKPVTVDKDAETDNEQTSSPDNDKQDSSNEPNGTETSDPNACEHTYTVASCTIPKMCTKCQHIAGHSLPHNYKNGTCIVCGKSEILTTFKAGDWVANIVKAGTNEQGEVLSQYILTQNKAAYENVVCYSNASACVLNQGKVIYNNKTYYSDWYPFLHHPVTWKEDENTITVTSWHNESIEHLEIVLTKTSETQMKVISSTDNANLPVGTIFNKT